VTAIEPPRAGPAAAAERDGAGAQARPPEYRYALVLALVLTLVVFVLLAPTAGWSRAVGLVIEGTALMVSIGTSRSRQVVRRRRTLAAAAAVLVGVITVAIGVVPSSVTLAISGLLAFAIPAALGGGLLRMVGERGVTGQVVAGSLAIYLVIGLVFAWTIGVVTRLDASPYFAQGTSGSDGQHVYFSFTVLTTTGFGDLTVAGPFGRTLTVLEMLTGQLYLVTVIGVVVGNFRRRDRQSP
jgi:Ion channel